ncbi:MAG: hypothetical protein N2Z21_06035 [Candidatus Sumerlaeaceae bacterium]|nr:hypothetical protein [Candidatus Sumerlaeaceae bacterium]
MTDPVRASGGRAWQFVWLIAIVFLHGCAGLLSTGRPEPDWLLATACAPYRPVDVPGRQRREAQQDAEMLARRELMNQLGRMRVTGGYTVNDIIARDTRLRAHVLELVRTAEVSDWQVDEMRGEVSVTVRVDRNRVRDILSPYGQQ